MSFELDSIMLNSNTRRPSNDSVKADQKMRLNVMSQTPLISDVPVTWEDRDGSPLEKQITEIIVGMAVAGQHLHRIWTEQQIAWKRQREEEAERRERERAAAEKRKEQERLAAIEQAKRDALICDAKAWQDAATIRAYVAAVRSSPQKMAAATDLEDWARWALAEADKLDPIASGRAFKVTSSPANLGEANPGEL